MRLPSAKQTTIAMMADRANSQPDGKQSRQPMRAPERLGQFIQPKPNGNSQRLESTSALPVSSTVYGSSFLAPLRRLAPQRAPVPRLPSPPSVRIPPIRRMAPQWQTAKRPAWQEPLLKPPIARQERKMAYVTSQTDLFPLILSGPEGEMNQSVARPRELKLLPPVSKSSRNSPMKQLSHLVVPSADVPPLTAPKPNSLIQQQRVREASPASITLAAIPNLDVSFHSPIHPTPFYTSIPPAEPIHPQLQIGPQSPFTTFVPNITPNKPLPPLPQMNASRFFTRLPQNTAIAEHYPRQYRPRTPPPSSFVSQSQMAAACRSASLPAFPSVGDESWAIRSLIAKDFKSRPTNKAEDAAAKDALDPVKFIDYTQIASFQYTKFPKAAEGKFTENLSLEATPPFGPQQAKVFVLKLLPALQYLIENHLTTPAETLSHTDLTLATSSWLLDPSVSLSPKSAGAHYGLLLFEAAKSLNNNWFTVEALPHFLWSKWTVPVTEMGWEWYLRVQDVFFRALLEGYMRRVREEFVVVGEVAYPMNTIVPRSAGSDMCGGGV